MHEALPFFRPSRRPATRAVLALGLLTWAAVSSAADIHVPSDQPTIQAGIDAALKGDRVLVSPGTYYEHIYVSQDISILSTDGPGSTVIDGSSAGTVVVIDDGSPLIQGFTITRGVGSIYGGGGMSVSGRGSPTISGNDFEFNSSSAGGAILVTGATARIHRNTFRHNDAEDGGAVELMHSNGHPVTSIDDNLFEFNGDDQCFGGAVLDYKSKGVEIERNVIRSNVAGYGAAALEVDGGTSLIADNLIYENRSNESAGGVELNVGLQNDGVTFVNNTVSGNSGEGLFVKAGPHGHPWIANNIIVATHRDFGLNCDDGKLGAAAFSHNLIFSTSGAQILGNCDVAGGGLLTVDPKFVGGDHGRNRHAYFLSPDSPAIDAGDDSVVHEKRDLTGAQRIQGAAVDLGAIEFRVE